MAGEGRNVLPLVHVDDLGDLCARVALSPAAHGIFHAAEESSFFPSTKERVLGCI